MRYGKKISAMLAVAMLISSSSAFAAVSDVAVDEVTLNDDVIIAETEQVAEISEEAVTVEDETVSVAESVTITVEQTPNGSVEISNNSLATSFTADIPAGVTANAVVSANDYFILTAPTEVVAKNDKSGVFDNPEVSINYVEFRNSGPEKIFIYEAMENGTITVYARFNDNKSIELVDLSGDTGAQVKYLPEDSELKGTAGDTVYGYVTFNVESGRKYQLFARGGTGRLFGVKFVGKNDATSTESLSVNTGDEIKVIATPDNGYVVSSINVDGKSVSTKSECTFKATANSVITATFEKDPTIVAAENQFNNLTLASEVTEDITLPAELANGLVKIAWESSDSTAIGVDGKVTRAVGKDVTVTLTATATINGTDTLTKTFNVTVKGLDLATEFEAAVFEVPETITEEFKVPGTFLDSKLVWTVDETRYITFGTDVDKDGNITATVTKPYYVEGDKAVVITATIEGTDIKKSFNATVIKNENSAEASTAHFVAEGLVLEGETGSTANKIVVKSDLDLPITDETYGGTITWQSSNPKVVSTSGDVKRQSKDVTVHLTAIVEIDGIKATKEFKLVVKGTGSSGGSGGGGGSYSSSYSPSTGGTGGVVGSYTEYSDIVADANINTNVETVKFTDLQNHTWAVPHITRLINNKIVNGVGDNKFDPDGLVTREQFATMLVRAFGFVNDTTNAKQFEDVVPGSYYAEAVAILNSMGIVNGQSETTFGVGQGITRQDMAVMCALATKLEGDKEVTEFGDAAEIADYAVESVTKMQKCGIFAGDENNNFNPTANATRAEAAKVISMILDCMEK